MPYNQLNLNVGKRYFIFNVSAVALLKKVVINLEHSKNHYLCDKRNDCLIVVP